MAHPSSPKSGTDLNLSKSLPEVPSKPYLTSWCGGMGCDNCKLCLIFSGKAVLIKADEKNLKLTYKIIEE